MKRQACLLLLTCAIVVAIAASTAATTREGFESPEVSWRLADYDGTAKLLLHERDFESARTGKGCEHVQIWAKQGTYAYLAHPVKPAPIIDELIPSVWIKANRPGLQIKARVVLPRSKDASGKPLTVLLGGDFYTDVSSWQQLGVRNITALLTSEAVRRGAQFGHVDKREAYLDHIVINGYGGPGTTEIRIDDLELEGVTLTNRVPRSGLPTQMPARATPAADSTAPRVEVRGSMVMADDRPLFARVIEHNGEAFRWLTQLGFNTIWLRTPPSDSQLSEAEQAGVWLICPAPLPGTAITSRHRQVLAWTLTEARTPEEMSIAWQNASRLHREDPASRPTIRVAHAGLASPTGGEDITLVGRRAFGTSFDLSNYESWLRSATSRLRHQPFWGSVQTELSASLAQQLAIGRNSAPAIVVTPKQLRLAAFSTVAAGARGICFRSRTRLDGSAPVSILRAKSLQLLNAELSLVEPWATGAEAKPLPDPHPDTRLTMLETDRSRLLLAIRHGQDEQYEPQATTGDPISVHTHNARMTDQAFLVTPIGLQPLLGSQAARSRITLRDPRAVSLVLLTQDPLAINRVAQDLGDLREQRAKLTLEIMKLQLDRTAHILNQLNQANTEARRSLDEARSMAERAEQLFLAAEYKHAWPAIRKAEGLVQQVRRNAWEIEVRNFSSPASSPLCASFATLALHRDAARFFGSGKWSRNLLPAGGLENLDDMLRSGWQQQRASETTAETLVELTRQNPASGQSALRLCLRENEAANRHGLDPPIEITSAPVAVRSGQVIRVHGWASVDNRIANTTDGLIIQDSQTGEDLAEHIQQTNGWHEFTLYRRCIKDGDLRLTFAMHGAGEVRLDDVSICVLQ